MPASVLPEVRDSAGFFGSVEESVLGVALEITGVAGDQQSAAIGQACLAPGEMKSTYGTGAFVLINTGTEPVLSKNRLLTTIAWRVKGETVYALEGSILSAGATVQWLRDGLGLIAKASEVEALAASADPDSGVYLVPAFTGLGAPYWDAEARGALVGLSRGSGRAEIAAAALDSVVHQTCDLLDAMKADAPTCSACASMAAWPKTTPSSNARRPHRHRSRRPVQSEATAWGAAFLAGWAPGFTRIWRRDGRSGSRIGGSCRIVRMRRVRGAGRAGRRLWGRVDGVGPGTSSGGNEVVLKTSHLVIPDGCPAQAGRKSGTHKPGVNPARAIG